MVERDDSTRPNRVEVVPLSRGAVGGARSLRTEPDQVSRPGTGPAGTGSTRPLISDRLYLGWHFEQLLSPPKNPPAPPIQPSRQRLSEHAIAQHRRQVEVGMQAWLLVEVLGAAVAILCILATIVGLVSGSNVSGRVVLGVVAGAVVVAVKLVRSSRRDELKRWMQEQQAQLDAIYRVAQRRYEADIERHNQLIDAHHREKEAFDRQWQWWAVAATTNLSRLDVLGGAPSGWSAEHGAPAGWDAMLTTFCGTRVEVGGEVTVLDLTGSAVAQSALDLFEAGGVARAAYLLPKELPLVHLGSGLSKDLLHEILSNVVHIAEETGTLAGWAQDSEILRGVIDSFPETPTVAQVLAGLRLLAQIGDVRADLASGLLTVPALNKLNALYGERAIVAGLGERLLKVVTHLQPLATLSTTPIVPRDVPLKVYALDRRAPAVTNEMLRAFLISAFTALVNQVAPREPWRRSIVVCGAERLTVSALRRLMDACAAAKVGLVLMYQTADESQQKLIGRGNAAVAFMRLGTFHDAKFASEFLGTEYQFMRRRQGTRSPTPPATRTPRRSGRVRPSGRIGAGRGLRAPRAASPITTPPQIAASVKASLTARAQPGEKTLREPWVRTTRRAGRCSGPGRTL
jgi:hypothetical protein